MDIVHCTDLWNAHAGHDSGRTDGAWPDPHLHCIRARVHQAFCRFTGSDIPANHLDPRVIFLDPPDAIEYRLGMPVGGVHHDDIGARLYQLVHAQIGIRPDTHGGTDQQASLIVLAGMGEVRRLLNILHCDQPAQLELVIDDQNLLDAVFVQQALDFLCPGTFLDGDQVLPLGHDFRHRLIPAGFKSQIAAGDDADERLAYDHRDPRNVFLPGKFEYFPDTAVRVYTDRILDDSAFVLLDHANFIRLTRNRQVFVDHAKAAFLRQRDGQAAFGHRVHGRRK